MRRCVRVAGSSDYRAITGEPSAPAPSTVSSSTAFRAGQRWRASSVMPCARMRSGGCNRHLPSRGIVIGRRIAMSHRRALSTSKFVRVPVWLGAPAICRRVASATRSCRMWPSPTSGELTDIRQATPASRCAPARDFSSRAKFVATSRFALRHNAALSRSQVSGLVEISWRGAQCDFRVPLGEG